MGKLIGWRSAARHIGGSVSEMRVRRAVERGLLRATKTPTGWEFDVDDLDKFRQQLALSGARVPDPAVAAAKGEVECELPEAAPRTAAPTMPASAPIPRWLLDACGDLSDNPEPEPARPERFAGPPLGATRRRGPTWLDQIPAAPAPAQLVEVEAARRDAAAARAQAEQAAQAIVHWRAAHRRERVQAIAGAVALEVLAAGHRDVQVVYGVRDAVMRALQQLGDTQLASDPHAYAYARTVAAQLLAWQLNDAPPPDDLSRARLRRSRR